MEEVARRPLAVALLLLLSALTTKIRTGTGATPQPRQGGASECFDRFELLISLNFFFFIKGYAQIRLVSIFFKMTDTTSEILPVPTDTAPANASASNGHLLYPSIWLAS